MESEAVHPKIIRLRTRKHQNNRLRLHRVIQAERLLQRLLQRLRAMRPVLARLRLKVIQAGGIKSVTQVDLRRVGEKDNTLTPTCSLRIY